MKKIITTILVVLLGTSTVQALPNWDIYSDAVIQDGNEFNVVSVYDTPPDYTTVDMLGGLVDTLDAYDESTINISGGTVNTLNSYESSTVNTFGGSIYGLYAYDTSMVDVRDNAHVDILRARGYSVVDVSGGTLDLISASLFGTVSLSGGLISDYLAAADSGIINVYGYNLSKVASGGGYGYGFVEGQWDDGTIFTIDFGGPDTYSRVMLIPEPSTLLLIITGTLFVRKHNR